LAERPGVWALGDCAAVGDPPLPATAQVAQQQGAYLAKLLVAKLEGRPLKPFRFRSFGMLAYIGGHQALADLPGVKWSGRAAFLFWRSVYLTKLVSLANKTKVLFDWIKTRLFGRDLSRF
jgi:NADH:ubiquinone reductase (non-electrogenic)